MRALKIVLAAALLVLAAAGGLYYWQQSHPPTLPAPPARVETAPPAAAKGPQFPVAPPAEPLPKLAESDPAVVAGLQSLLGGDPVRKLFRPEELIRNVVATIDNLPRRTAAERLSPVNPPAGPFRAAGKGEALAISRDNAARYAPYVRALESADTAQLVALYLRLYPLFQQAYVDLGFPNAYFNDRLVEVIDHLMEAPEVKGPVKLTQPHVLYEFADDALEDLSAGQKMIVRMGPENGARVKSKLADIRREILAQSRKP